MVTQSTEKHDMLAIRHADERGLVDLGWLNSRHTFSFGHYHDPRHMGFGALRVINEDVVAPGQGFGTHGHQDMEIISCVLAGELEHKDSLGTGSLIRRGDVQRMSAGTGVRHSEFNASASDAVHFLQIWILPERQGLSPGYEQKSFADEEKRDRLRLIGSRDGRLGSVTIHRDVDLHAAVLAPGSSVAHKLGGERKAWVQMIRGTLEVNGQLLLAGDGLAIEGHPLIEMSSSEDSEVLLFDMGD